MDRPENLSLRDKIEWIIEELRKLRRGGGGSSSETNPGLSAVAYNNDYNSLSNKPDLSLKADLENGKIPATQLPSYVDDVLDLKENVANKATDLLSPNNNKYPTTLAVANENKKATITVELISQLTTNFYAPNALRITSTALISGSGTLTLKVNDVAYTLTDLIPQGAKITAETTSSSVYNLISIYE